MGVGRFLFRWRGTIGGFALLLVLALGRPTVTTCLSGVPLLLAGLAVRFWAMGFIGIEARAREVGALRRVTGGPYRLLGHPLYIGNLLLVLGVLVALSPALAVAISVVVLFLLEYGLIVASEERALATAVPAPARFLLANALHEWRTWLAAGIALGLAWAKALLSGA